METPSFFHKFSQARDQAPPHYVILDISQHTTELRSKLKELPGSDVEYPNEPYRNWDEDQIMEMIIGYLSYKENAKMELAIECMEIVRQALHGAFEEYAVVLGNAIEAFGEALYEQLSQHEIYQNGYLFYQFHGWAGRDIILERFSRDDLSGDLRHDRYPFRK